MFYNGRFQTQTLLLLVPPRPDTRPRPVVPSVVLFSRPPRCPSLPSTSGPPRSLHTHGAGPGDAPPEDGTRPCSSVDPNGRRQPLRGDFDKDPSSCYPDEEGPSRVVHVDWETTSNTGRSSFCVSRPYFRSFGPTTPLEQCPGPERKGAPSFSERDGWFLREWTRGEDSVTSSGHPRRTQVRPLGHRPIQTLFPTVPSLLPPSFLWTNPSGPDLAGALRRPRRRHPS